MTASESNGSLMNNDGIVGLIDVDCNLLHKDLLSFASQVNEGKNKEELINEGADPTDILKHPSTKKSNIVGVLSPSSTIEESIKSLTLPNKVDGIQIRTTAGVHPYHAEEMGSPYSDDDDSNSPSSSLIRLQTLIQENTQNLASVGECGLDYSPGFPSRETQIPWFKAQIDLAYEYNLPLFIHERLAFEDTLSLIDDAAQKHSEKSSHPKIIIHCFTGTRSECKEYVSRGYYLSISGFLLKPPMGDEIRQCLVDGIIPLDKLMIETDAPYMGFSSCRDEYLAFEQDALDKLNGKKRKRLRTSTYPNVPSSLVQVLEGVTDALNEGHRLRGGEELGKGEIAKWCTKNARDFFDFS